MPTLVLSHRYSPDSNALFGAAIAAGWDVERLHGFRCPDGLAARDPVFYGETLGRPRSPRRARASRRCSRIRRWSCRPRS